MYSVRNSVFETNSSSTHSLIICSDKEYQDWMNHKLVYDSYSKKFCESKKITLEDREKAESMYDKTKTIYMKSWIELPTDVQESYIKENILKDKDPYQYKSYDDYCDDMNQHEEQFEEIYKTEHGDIIHVLGYSGYDG